MSKITGFAVVAAALLVSSAAFAGEKAGITRVALKA